MGLQETPHSQNQDTAPPAPATDPTPHSADHAVARNGQAGPMEEGLESPPRAASTLSVETVRELTIPQLVEGMDGLRDRLYALQSEVVSYKDYHPPGATRDNETWRKEVGVVSANRALHVAVLVDRLLSEHPDAARDILQVIVGNEPHAQDKLAKAGKNELANVISSVLTDGTAQQSQILVDAIVREIASPGAGPALIISLGRQEAAARVRANIKLDVAEAGNKETPDESAANPPTAPRSWLQRGFGWTGLFDKAS